MTWKQVLPMDEKVRFISDYLNGVFSFTELCARYGISRKTGYKWVDRYVEGGAGALEDRPRTPRSSPRRTPAETEQAILEIRRKHPTWGGAKILVMLERRRHPGPLPCRSTVAEILKRHGCIAPARSSRRRAHPGPPTTEAKAPNQLWSADFKGQFKTRDGRYCYPLTVTDAFSRSILSIRGMLSPITALTKQEFQRLFRNYGLPERIRTDNGTPFASTALGRLSQLSVWWIRLGIVPELIEPGKPQQNGRHERMHRTLKAETTRPPEADLAAQQQRFERFRHEFNVVRPHEALGQATPASRYTPSPRKLSALKKSLDYPGHYEQRLVSANGGIRWRNDWVNVTRLLAGNFVGLEELDDGLWEVYYGPVRLGRLDEGIMRIVG